MNGILQAAKIYPRKNNAKSGSKKANVPNCGQSKNVPKPVAIAVRIWSKPRSVKSGKAKENVQKNGWKKSVPKLANYATIMVRLHFT